VVKRKISIILRIDIIKIIRYASHMNTDYDRLDGKIDTANLLHSSALRLFRLLRATRPATGLSSSKLSVLGRLYRDGVATATELAAYLRIQPQSLTRLIAELERRKLITRRPSDTDRRQHLLEITDEGVQLLMQNLRDERVRLAQIIADTLTPAEQELLRLAAGLMDHLSTVTEAQTAASGEKKRDDPRSAAPRKRRSGRGAGAKKR
jgi:DNA-binding MarR family transcriptional regulator